MRIRQLKREARALQQPVDDAALQAQLPGALPGRDILAVTELAAGLFNNTYRLATRGGDYALKVAPADDAAVFYNERRLMQREQTLAQSLCAASPLVPEYLAFFTLDGRAASLQPWVEGRLWHDVTASLSDAENAALWTQLGAFARRLHRVEGSAFGYPAPLAGCERWSDFIVDNVAGLVADARRLDVMCDEIEAYLAQLPHFIARLDTVTTPRLLHGDLWPRNVIIDGSGAGIHIKAVIDGERAYWGDPVSDWVMILYDKPAAFWQGYGENLPDNTDPARIAIYKGMYFILNILEATRCPDPAMTPVQWLAGVNRELARLR